MFWPLGRAQFRESDSCTGRGEVFGDGGVRAAAGDRGDLAVAEASDEEGEVVALASGELSEDAQGFAGFERIVDRGWVGDDLLPAHDRRERLEVRVASFDRRQAVGLVNCYNAQPGEDRAALGLVSEQDGPGVLAGVLDQFWAAFTTRATARLRSRWWRR